MVKWIIFGFLVYVVYTYGEIILILLAQQFFW